MPEEVLTLRGSEVVPSCFDDAEAPGGVADSRPSAADAAGPRTKLKLRCASSRRIEKEKTRKERDRIEERKGTKGRDREGKTRANW